MAETLWTDVDRWFGEALGAGDADLEAALRASSEAGLPEIQVSALQGKFLGMIVGMTGAARVLEIGTLGGYSTLWMAKALPPGGRIVTLEYEEKHAAVARATFARAGVADRIEVVVGRAADTLPGLAGPFDLVFIDADKPSNPLYLDWALKLGRPGTVIILDNAVRGGKVVTDPADANAEGVRQYVARAAREGRLVSTALQMVGPKGYDGWVVSRMT